MKSTNIYFIATHPIQYFIPLYKYLATKEGVCVKVIYLTDVTTKGALDSQFGIKFTWDIPLLDGYSYTFIKNRSWKQNWFDGFWGLFNPDLHKVLKKLPKGLVVISGWDNSSYIMGYIFSKFFGHKVAIRCDAPVFKEWGRKGIKNRARGFFIKNILFRYWIDYCLYLGKQNKAFYEYFGVEKSKLIFSPFSVDNERFSNGVLNTNIGLERKALGYEDSDFVILFTGKLIPIKRPLDLIKAFQMLDCNKKKLLIVGDGLLRNDLIEYVSNHGIDNVQFLGFINQEELPKYYGVSNLLVLCSESDTWGLSINEGMACGMPVIVSSSVGCGEDLVHNERNGYIYPKGNIKALSNSIRKIIEHENKGSEMGKESQIIIHDYSIERTAQGILDTASADN